MKTLVWVVALALGCGGGEAGDGDGDGDFVPSPPPGCELEPIASVWPDGPYGTDVGETLAPVELSDCDGVELDMSDLLGQSELLLVNVGAGWCDPCIEETETIDVEIFQEFCPRGLRVVQIVFQNEKSERATQLFCNEWRSRFELNFPVLYDPLFESNQYFDDIMAQTPINFLVAPNGEIVFRETGTPALDLPERIDMMLPP